MVIVIAGKPQAGRFCVAPKMLEVFLQTPVGLWITISRDITCNQGQMLCEAVLLGQREHVSEGSVGINSKKVIPGVSAQVGIRYL